MEKQIVTVKSSKLSTECNTFMQNIEQCLEIVSIAQTYLLHGFSLCRNKKKFMILFSI